MRNESLAVIVLAAGLGKRMGSTIPKVLHKTRESTLIHHVLATADQLEPDAVVVVTGFLREQVEAQVINSGNTKHFSTERIVFAHQLDQKGTGDAVRAACDTLQGFKGTCIILYGDVPLVKAATLQRLLDFHHERNATVTLLSFLTDNPAHYGRVIRAAPLGEVERIIEAKDCSPEQLLVKEVNAGIYVVDAAFLAPAVKDLKNNNSQGEYYLTDIIERAVQEGQRVVAQVIHDSREVLGVNTLADLQQVNHVLLARMRERLVTQGVSFDDVSTFYADPEVTVASGVHFGPHVILKGTCQIDEGVMIEGSCFLRDVQVKKNAVIRFSVRAEQSVIGEESTVGPFAHLRPGSVLERKVKIGNFVETKKVLLHPSVSVSHLTYLGDCEVGTKSNIGAGTITCNYDGIHKHQTHIGENVFVGSNTALVAPITIGNNATVGAGSVIQSDVEPDSLVVTRAPLHVKQRYIRGKKKEIHNQ